MPSSENSICILGQSMVYSLMLMAGPPAGCAVVAQLDRALDSDSKGQRFESPRPHQKAAVLDGGLFLLLSRGAGQQKSPSPAPKRQSREGLSCFVGGFGGLTGRTRARRGPSTLQEAQQRPDERPLKQRGGQLAPASAGIPVAWGAHCCGAISSGASHKGACSRACRQSQTVCKGLFIQLYAQISRGWT